MDMALLDIIWLHNIALVLGEETDNQEVASLNKFESQQNQRNSTIPNVLIKYHTASVYVIK